jgi:ferredoxin-NADP reductase
VSPVAYHELETELVVSRRQEAAEDVVALTLVDPRGRQLPQWTPGAHIDVMLGPSLVRQYSLCGSVRQDGSWRIGVLRDPDSRGGSRTVHDQLQEGSTVRVRGPRNHFPLVRSARYQFIAGGIGITPILAMLEAANAIGADWNLLYGGRRRSSMAFVDELSAYDGQVKLWPQDEQGLLDLDSVLGTPRDDTLVYCCGPEALLGAVEERCASWPAGSLHIERFSARPQPLERPPDARETFTVVCQRSGLTVTVPPDMSIFDAVEEAGVDVVGSCMEGVCGTCECTVLDGTPDHRDSLLTAAEQAESDVMYICVSRSRSDELVLDI